MSELQWPAWVVGAHTIPQLIPLTRDAPDRRRTTKDPAEFQEARDTIRQQKEAEEKAWDSN